ncbi:MAG: multicopper oxidase domain-containing protein [Acidobacteriota bacterium]
MATRRDLLKLALATGGGTLAARRAAAQNYEYTRFLCPPDDRPRDLDDMPPSPPARPFAVPLFKPPVMQPVADPKRNFLPPPNPAAHQRYEEFRPQKFYEIHEREFRWAFHSDPPYAGGTWVWGFQDGVGKSPPSSPGPTYLARYGEPVMVRRYNSLPTVGHSEVRFALPSTTSHLHNGHTASESDGNPQDWIDSGEFWDHHYGNFPAAFDPREKLTTLWYHDHRLDFTAANVYAGLFGFYFLFDEDDTGDETTGWRLPSGDYDVAFVLEDMRFDVDEAGHARMVFENFNTDGMIGDRMTVNRIITPYLQVEPRKYRLRILNGGPSRFYQLFLRASRKVGGTDRVNFTVITGDGNFLPEPVVAESLFMSVAQRYDVILDFSAYKPGDHLYLHNLLEQINGRGPSGRMLDTTDEESLLMRFDVVAGNREDPSRIPDFFRPLPSYDLDQVRRERTWVFDYDGGLWTINGKVMEPNRIDAGIDQGSFEIWNFRNGGNDWSHPIHSHFSEFIILEVNGKPFEGRFIQDKDGEEMSIGEYLGRPPEARRPIRAFYGGARRDVATLLPDDELKVIMRWPDFLGKHVMHCHNVVHEDHAMMVRWDIMEPGKGFSGSKQARDVYGPNGPLPEPFPDPRPESKPHLEIRPRNPAIEEG